jgi:hypothetical protein
MCRGRLGEVEVDEIRAFPARFDVLWLFPGAPQFRLKCVRRSNGYFPQGASIGLQKPWSTRSSRTLSVALRTAATRNRRLYS